MPQSALQVTHTDFFFQINYSELSKHSYRRTGEDCEETKSGRLYSADGTRTSFSVTSMFLVPPRIMVKQDNRTSSGLVRCYSLTNPHQKQNDSWARCPSILACVDLQLAQSIQWRLSIHRLHVTSFHTSPHICMQRITESYQTACPYLFTVHLSAVSSWDHVVFSYYAD